MVRLTFVIDISQCNFDLDPQQTSPTTQLARLISKKCLSLCEHYTGWQSLLPRSTFEVVQ
jgi:hypothetical protein